MSGAHSAERKLRQRPVGDGLHFGFVRALGRLTRKYVSLVASSTEKILTSEPERNQESHNTVGTSATPMPRSAARTTANIVSSSITFFGSGVSRPTSSAQLCHANRTRFVHDQRHLPEDSLPAAQLSVRVPSRRRRSGREKNNREVLSPCGTVSERRIDTSAVAGCMEGRGSRVSICMSISGCAAQKLVRRGMNNSLAKNGGNSTRNVCLPLRACDLRKAAIEGLQQRLHLIEQRVSGSRELQRAVLRFEQPHSERILQLLHLVTDGGGREKQFVRGELEAAMARSDAKALRFLRGGDGIDALWAMGQQMCRAWQHCAKFVPPVAGATQRYALVCAADYSPDVHRIGQA